MPVPHHHTLIPVASFSVHCLSFPFCSILFMVPIYSVESWLALRYNEQKFYFATLRETYEGESLARTYPSFLKAVSCWMLTATYYFVGSILPVFFRFLLLLQPSRCTCSTC